MIGHRIGMWKQKKSKKEFPVQRLQEVLKKSMERGKGKKKRRKRHDRGNRMEDSDML